MILCVVVAVTLFVVLPKFGVPLAGATLLIPLLMIGCCVIPMAMMMFASPSGEKGGCCGKMANSKTSSPDGKEQNPASQKPSCH